MQSTMSALRRTGGVQAPSAIHRIPSTCPSQWCCTWCPLVHPAAANIRYQCTRSKAWPGHCQKHMGKKLVLYHLAHNQRVSPTSFINFQLKGSKRHSHDSVELFGFASSIDFFWILIHEISWNLVVLVEALARNWFYFWTINFRFGQPSKSRRSLLMNLYKCWLPSRCTWERKWNTGHPGDVHLV